MTAGAYTRTISMTEAKEGYIMILKSGLAMFPMKGSSFSLVAGGSTKRAAVESYHCECRGPAEPHEHYFVRWPHLKAGDTVILEKDPRRSGTYTLKVRSGVAQKGLCG